MKGVIVMWSGAIVDIPAGWHLCDGTEGTPDLRNRFVVGAGDTYNPGDAGGALTHGHTFTSDGHTHDRQTYFNKFYEAAEDLGIAYASVVGATVLANHLPPYYALAFIMCLDPV